MIAARGDGHHAGEAFAAHYGERVRSSVDDLVLFGETAARLVARGKAAYDSDETLRLASEAIIHKIGEAVSRLMRQSEQFTTDHPEIPWTRMKAARNVVAHDYLPVDYEIIWNALAHDVPRITAQLRVALDNR